mgnify:CR=1 FL=1
MSKPVFILNGPNLNRLGLREPAIYGSTTLAEVETRCRSLSEGRGRPVEFRQSNHEGVLVDWIQEAGDSACGLIINPGAYTHTSIALHDAVRGTEIPVIELHISNVHAREEFRRHSYLSSVVRAVICGLGVRGYEVALDALHDICRKEA